MHVGATSVSSPNLFCLCTVLSTICKPCLYFAAARICDKSCLSHPCGLTSCCVELKWAERAWLGLWGQRRRHVSGGGGAGGSPIPGPTLLRFRKPGLIATCCQHLRLPRCKDEEAGPGDAAAAARSGGGRRGGLLDRAAAAYHAVRRPEDGRWAAAAGAAVPPLLPPGWPRTLVQQPPPLAFLHDTALAAPFSCRVRPAPHNRAVSSSHAAPVRSPLLPGAPGRSPGGPPPTLPSSPAPPAGSGWWCWAQGGAVLGWCGISTHQSEGGSWVLPMSWVCCKWCALPGCVREPSHPSNVLRPNGTACSPVLAAPLPMPPCRFDITVNNFLLLFLLSSFAGLTSL